MIQIISCFSKKNYNLFFLYLQNMLQRVYTEFTQRVLYITMSSMCKTSLFTVSDPRYSLSDSRIDDSLLKLKYPRILAVSLRQKSIRYSDNIEASFYIRMNRIRVSCYTLDQNIKGKSRPAMRGKRG